MCRLWMDLRIMCSGVRILSVQSWMQDVIRYILEFIHFQKAGKRREESGRTGFSGDQDADGGFVEELAERLNRYRRPVVFLGDGVPVYENVLAEKLTVPYSFAPAYMNRQRAAVVGTLAIQYYKSGKFETAERSIVRIICVFLRQSGNALSVRKKQRL